MLKHPLRCKDPREGLLFLLAGRRLVSQFAEHPILSLFVFQLFCTNTLLVLRSPGRFEGLLVLAGRRFV